MEKMNKNNKESSKKKNTEIAKTKLNPINKIKEKYTKLDTKSKLLIVAIIFAAVLITIFGLWDSVSNIKGIYSEKNTEQNITSTQTGYDIYMQMQEEIKKK